MLDRIKRTLLALLTVVLAGCSLRYVDGPPVIRPGAPVPPTADCTISSTMPVVDIILGAASVLAIREAVDGSDGINSWEVFMFALPVGAFGSAHQGFRRISACKRFLATPMAPDTTGSSPKRPALNGEILRYDPPLLGMSDLPTPSGGLHGPRQIEYGSKTGVASWAPY